jgi:hypothetical protein
LRNCENRPLSIQRISLVEGRFEKMAITEQQIRSIVEQVVSKMIPEHKAVTDKSVTDKSIEPLNQTGTYSEMDKLIDAAKEA